MCVGGGVRTNRTVLFLFNDFLIYHKAPWRNSDRFITGPLSAVRHRIAIVWYGV